MLAPLRAAFCPFFFCLLLTRIYRNAVTNSRCLAARRAWRLCFRAESRSADERVVMVCCCVPDDPHSALRYLGYALRPTRQPSSKAPRALLRSGLFFSNRAEGGLRLGCWRKRRILEYACHVVFVGRWWTHLWRFACSTRWPALFFFFFLTGFVKPEKARGTVIAGLHRHMQGAAVTGHRFIGSIVAHRSVVSGRNGFAGGIRQLFASTCAKR